MAFKRIQSCISGSNPGTQFQVTFEQPFILTRSFSLVYLTPRRLCWLTRTKSVSFRLEKTLFSCKFCKKETYVRSTKAVLSPSCKPRYDRVLVILQLVSSKKLTELLLCKFQNLDFVLGLFTWSGGPRPGGVGFFCFHAPEDTKQKKPTPLDRGPPLHVNRV